MLRVFLVEDESIIRETLRDTVPWARCGYTFVGEASDGEMALPLIRKVRPDVLITDIRMPFMDGLELSRQVLQKFPDMKIIIISGYDDFEYAQKAIGIGVEQYLLKPITKNTLIGVLEAVREKTREENARKKDPAYRMEDGEYERYVRWDFFERRVTGTMPESQVLEEAARLNLELQAECYALAFLVVLPEQPGEADDGVGTLGSTAQLGRTVALEDVVYCENDNEAFGAIQILEEYGYTCGEGGVAVISFDATYNALVECREGKIAFVAECNPLLGDLAASVIETIEAGAELEKYQYVEERGFTSGDITEELLSSRKY